MNKQVAIEELLWTACRAEGMGTVEYGTRDILPDTRKGQEIRAENERDNDIYNLGVTAGIHALLEQLSNEGYKLVNASGVTVRPEVMKGKTPTYGESFKRRLTPSLKLKLAISNPPKNT